MTRTRQRQRRPQYRSRPDGMDYAMRGMVDMSKMAMVGGMTIGMMGAMGNMFPKQP